ncbi:hypothetical protein ACIGXM_08915 [Kitasatospora sp. NPDC052896]|uniref:PspA-associated protein PspAA n=1 Tax=Kitasatospora sp. NPDC052896 TaxID=3364061 RepID=UPI0037C8AA99
MIVRILGEGRYEVAEQPLGELDGPDATQESTTGSGGRAASAIALPAPLDVVRRPDRDVTPGRATALLPGEDLVPG